MFWVFFLPLKSKNKEIKTPYLTCWSHFFLTQPRTVGFLGFKHTVMAPVELLNKQQPQVLLLKETFNPFFAQPVFELGMCLCCYDPGAGLCTWLCWTSEGLHSLTPQACRAPSGWHPCPSAHWPHKTI